MSPAVIATMLAVSVPLTAATAWKVEVDDARPLMRAVDELQARLGVPIHYEDPPFQHADDLEDITDRVPQTPQQRAANPGVKFIVPRGGRLSVNLTGQSVGLQVSQTIAEYHARGFPGRFTVIDFLIRAARHHPIPPVASCRVSDNRHRASE
jgi:hypothetical protein